LVEIEKLANEVCFGGISTDTCKSYKLVRFIHKEHQKSCLDGDVLIGSLIRNKSFDDERFDSDESSYEIVWKNEKKEKWLLNEDECAKFIGVETMKKIGVKKITGSGSLTFKNKWVKNKNIFSLSFSIIKKGSHEYELEQLDNIRKNIGMPEDSFVLEFYKPSELIKILSETLSKKSKLSYMPVSSWIKYKDRINYSGSFEDFKKTMNTERKGRNIAPFFIKTTNYSNDCELRVIWLGHKNKEWNQIDSNKALFEYDCPNHEIINIGNPNKIYGLHGENNML